MLRIGGNDVISIVRTALSFDEIEYKTTITIVSGDSILELNNNGVTTRMLSSDIEDMFFFGWNSNEDGLGYRIGKSSTGRLSFNLDASC
jgi:hypothetical protein